MELFFYIIQASGFICMLPHSACSNVRQVPFLVNISRTNMINWERLDFKIANVSKISREKTWENPEVEKLPVSL